MSTVLSRAQGLLARAAHPGTPAEEARTCGVLLAKLIVEHDLQLTERVAERALPPRGKWIRSKFDSQCKLCAEPIVVGEQVWWVPKQGISCRGCAAAARSA